MDDEEFPDGDVDEEIDPEVSELAWRTLVEIKAKQMSQEYRVDAKRVEAIIYQLAEVGWTGFKFPYRNALEVAFDYFKPAKALELFEAEPLDKLAERFYFVHYIRLKETGMYSLDELSNLTDEFISHLESNRQHLVQTGWPQTTFEKCRWLDWYLNMLYFVKLPLIEGSQHWFLDRGVEHARKPGRFETLIERTKDGNYRWEYRWAKEAAMREIPWPADRPTETKPEWHGGYFVTGYDARTLDQHPVTLCDYEQAGLLEGLDPQDAARIEDLRPRLFDIKVSILRRLLGAARNGDASSLWSDCLHILTDKSTGLMADEAEFLMGIESLLAEFRPSERSAYSHSQKREVYHIAGLSDLFEVVGHFEKEITIGTMERTKQVLMELPSGLSFESYFEVVGKQWQQVVDRAAELAFELASEEKNFWETYQRRVNEALEKEFYEDVLFHKKRRRKYRHKYDRTADTLLDFVGTVVEATGEPPPIKLHVGETATPPKDYVFRREDDAWKIKYEGIERTLENSLGIEYIHFLIKHPGQVFTAPHLETIIKERRLDPSTDDYRKMTDEQLAEENLRITGKEDIGDDDDKIDKRGRENYRRTLSQLKEKREEALKGAQTKLAEHCQRQIESIETRLQADSGLGGRPRKFSDEDEKARQRVCRAIDRGLVKIEGKNLPLWRHLNTALKPLGYHLSYRPDRVLHWVTQ